jgi:hypothetical protein
MGIEKYLNNTRHFGGKGGIQIVTKYHIGGGKGWQKCRLTIFINNFTTKG